MTRKQLDIINLIKKSAFFKEDNVPTKEKAITEATPEALQSFSSDKVIFEIKNPNALLAIDKSGKVSLYHYPLTERPKLIATEESATICRDLGLNETLLRQGPSRYMLNSLNSFFRAANKQQTELPEKLLSPEYETKARTTAKR